VLPLLRLSRRFGLAEPGGKMNALVVGAGLGAAGIAIDRIVGKREIVVRTITDPLIQVVGVSGATELGDGRPVLILDTHALILVARTQGRPVADHGAGVTPSYKRGSEHMMTETPSVSETFVLFELAGTGYGVPSRLVRQIEMVEQITPVPNAPPFVAGLVFSRGHVIPALDLRARFGFDKIPYTPRTRLIVVQAGERTVGMIVDSAREFVTIGSDAIQPPPEAIAGLSGAYVEGIARLGERLVVLLDLDEVLSGTEAPTRDDA
jgi:chemotaxis signal transduction protein